MTPSTENSAPDIAASGAALASLPRGFFAAKFSAARRVSALVALMLVASSLGGCGSNSKGPPGPCPDVVVPKQTQYLTKFAGNGSDLSDIAYEAKVDTFTTFCVYSVDQEPAYIRTNLKVQLAATRGPKFSGDHITLKYAIGVTGPGGKIIPGAKQVLDMDIDFSKGQVANINADEINVTIPVKQGENGDFYRVLLGLDLTQDQLDYNKRNPRQ
ncbi:MAG TPA: hypothetical protein VM659_07740 [Dongiaceae bacterium]|nr:hypothetical protein [Dongiaceae bacterium]